MSYSFPTFDFSFEKHVIEIKKDLDIKVDVDVDLDWDIDVKVDKDYDVDVDVDLKIDGNTATLEWDIETPAFITSFQVATVVEAGESSLSQLQAAGAGFEYTAVSSASGTPHFLKTYDTFTEISFVALISEEAGSNFVGSSIAAVDTSFLF